MQKIIFYVVVSLCFFVSKITAQETFEERAKMIAQNIESITKEEKQALKDQVDDINKQLEMGRLTQEQADKMKIEIATVQAKKIENRVAMEQEKLNALVQEKVEGKISDTTKVRKKRRYGITVSGGELNEEGKEKRTTSQFVIAGGFNNLVTNGAVANSDFGYLRSVFYEWGFTKRTRLAKESNLLHLKYGLSFMYNIVAPTDNRYFVDNGKETVLETFPIDLRKKDTYFKNVYIAIPLHLEFDFSKKSVKEGKKFYKSHDGFRFGLGGYAGYNINSKQFLSYEVDGYRIKEKQKGNWNVNDWNYGLSSYLGWGQTSLYVKYDLSPLFKDNPVKQNNVSLGVRFDLN
ncbi:hypothetical protein FCR2A7T_15670 [Flavobacterium cauense R2A-7]|uniref:Outer membrane protein with beta-barrel domain n=1 Tax=Flavobacterium cauense R2A-7 TaxID=1341154 RepID=V6S1N9_9FLAO|nr:hypothetical protein [Flavobacterium cauense]ESU20152.1 hypothetical protein FCR2A7T_15670 [Flavobacterium cauense R2A-7]KGO83952.1 hypothetical protein Q762_01540 [Flavobacterium cauense R2A-7]TWI14706.1 hypothetical protein IP98_00676 [Flavobacterium cauense R2A-7]